MSAQPVQPFSPDELAAARAAGGRMLDALAGIETEPAPRLARLARTFALPLMGHAQLMILSPDFAVMPFEQALRRECIALRGPDGALLLVLADPFDRALVDGLGARLAEPFALALADHDDIAACLARHEDEVRRAAGLSETRGGEKSNGGAEDLSLKRISEDASPVVKLVNSTLYDALKQGASDIHLECVPAGLVIQYRIDGVLSRVGSVQGSELAEQAISRIKVMAELDIAERRVPQDGRFKALAAGREIDFRVSIMPSVHGEDAVIRILDKESISEQFTELTLDILGFPEQELKRFRKYIHEPYGMVLVTGPTGSGKTTTLYAGLSEIRSPEDKIITIEDPVEYQLRGITQIPINEKKGLTFARGLRSILRHDPDKIMVGEIRDPETTQIAIQSALTGHLVFTTVHANNVVDVLGRFLNMGVEPYQFVSALNCVMAQRLVRLTCRHCKRVATVSPELLIESGLDPALATTHTFYEGAGCIDCGGTGFKGRTAICELLNLSDRIREMILERRPNSEVKRAAHEEGMRSLRESAVEKVMLGMTTLREINKVTFVE